MLNAYADTAAITKEKSQADRPISELPNSGKKQAHSEIIQWHGGRQ
jgi:hypothetical protein